MALVTIVKDFNDLPHASFKRTHAGPFETFAFEFRESGCHVQAFDISGTDSTDKRVNQGFSDTWRELLAHIIINGTVS